MSEKADSPGSPKNVPDRKITKPLMEKRRRARINTCLSELKTLLLSDVDEKESGRFAKLEKADILEMTVKYLRNRQVPSVNGHQTALYRAGFNKCMEELSSFLNIDDGHSANLRLKLTGHLAEILCSMNSETLTDTSTLSQQPERSNVSPGFHVTSSSDEPSHRGPSLKDSPSFPTPVSSNDVASHSGPEPNRCKATQSDCSLPLCVKVESDQSKVGTVTEDMSPRSQVPSYTTIPVLPTMVNPGQVILLVANNNGGRIQLPTLASSIPGQFNQSNCFQPMFLGGSSCLQNVNNSDLNFGESNKDHTIQTQILDPTVGSGNFSKTGSPYNSKSIPNNRRHPSENDAICITSKSSSKNVQERNNEFHLRNDGAVLDDNQMWRPW